MSKRLPLNALLTERALSFLAVNAGHSGISDHLIDQAPPGAPIKNVCAKVSVQLSDEIDHYCDLLNISKRRFLEAAMIDALEQLKQIASDEGVFDYLDELSLQQAGEASK